MDITIVVIENDIEKYKEDPLIWALQDKFKKVEFFDKPNEGIDYIKKHLEINMIVLLDIDFPANEKNGHMILEEISKMSLLVPVILWSGVDENEEEFSDFINNHAFGFLSKTVTTEEAFKIIEKAEFFLKTSLDNVLEDWIINKKEDKDTPIYITSDGQSFTLNDILKEIRHQTPIGKEFSRRLTTLTIDLLLRKKENLNG